MRTTPRIGLRRLGVVTAIVLASAALFVAPASAHTKLIKSTPERGASVEALTEITLVFSENVNPSIAKVQLRDAAGGQRGSAKAPRVEGATVTQSAAPDLAPGDYTIAYRVVSADGHPVTGEVPFTLTGAAKTQETAAAAASVAPTAAATADPVADTPVTPKAEKSSGSSAWPVAGAGLLIGVLIGMGLVLFRKRKSSSTSDQR
ncbi:copper resistance CopC family protein [Actinomadura alba]|uniref:Copper resistance protein CopC n=1 Tax=Actinomadura alba TaxID=406431 RepID=A0ABR7LLF0_9ACTN|nr:copper resistance CopC family protein [Actinomadura alba]MBC6465312.1 copper resistance protein CopC [Actinomadura alba]